MKLKKRIFSSILVLALLIALLPTSIAFASTTGASSWAVQEIEEAIQNQLVTQKVLSGYQQNITREEFAELAVKLYEALSKQKATAVTPNPFTDTSNVEVLKANKLGIVGGVAADKFAPLQPITRQEISVMLFRTIKAAAPQPDYNTPATLKFADEGKIASWAMEAVKYLNHKGIMGGIGGNQINPEGNTTREQAIVLVQRSFKEFSKGNAITIGMAAPPTTLDPQGSTDTPSSRVNSQIYETLLIIGENKSLSPGLAESWKQIDELTYEFVLKKGVKFHNGETLTAKDVSFTLKRAINNPQLAHIVNYIDSNKILVIDDYTVRISTNVPYSSVLYNLTHISTGIVNEKAVTKLGKNYDSNPIGTGPYQLSSYKQNEIILNSFNDYHGTKPLTDKLILKFTYNVSTLTLLETGQIDIAYDLYPNDALYAKANSNLTLYADPGLSTTYVGLNVSKKHLDNVKVRQAINYAVNPKEIVDAYYYLGTYATGPIGANILGAHPSLQLYEYNLSKAKKLLAEAGYNNGLSLSIAVNEGSQLRMDLALILKNYLSKINIKLEIHSLEWSEFLEATASGDYDMFILGWSTVTGEADYGLYNLFHSTMIGSAGNRSYYSNPKVDELLDLARQTSDTAKRKEYYYKAQELIHEDAPLIYLYNSYNLTATKKNITGFKQHPSGAHRLSTVGFK